MLLAEAELLRPLGSRLARTVNEITGFREKERMRERDRDTEIHRHRESFTYSCKNGALPSFSIYSREV